jgi:hypothetical protein
MVSAAPDVQASGIFDEFFCAGLFLCGSKNIDPLFRLNERFSAS